MKKFVKHTLFSLGFLAGLLALVLLFSWVLTPKGNESGDGMDEATMNALFAEPENTVDVIVLGDSVTYRGIAPLETYRESGITMYVSGTPMQLFCYTESLMRRIYETQSPKYVLLDMNVLFNYIPFTKELLYRIDDKIKIFRYHNRWKTLQLSDFTGSRGYTRRERDKGHVIDTAVQPAYMEGYDAPTDEFAYVNPRNKSYFEHFLQYCAEHGTEVILTSVPNNEYWNMVRHNTVQYIADSYGIAFVDMNLCNEEIGIDWNTHTIDGGRHLNHWGAKKVGAFLGRYLREHTELADHREDPEYESWNECLREYDAYAAENLREISAAPEA